MLSSINVECSQCGRNIDLNNTKINADYTIEIHDGEKCYFCEECNDGDYGIIECGKCGKELRRFEAFLSIKYLYTCNDCEDDE